MTRWRTLLGLATGVALLAGCTGDSRPAVETATVGRADVVEIVNAPATVAARAQSSVSAPAEGTIAEVLAADGDRVVAGQPLLRVSSPAAQERLRRAREADAKAAAAVPRPTTPSLTGLQANVDAAAAAAFAAARAAAEQAPRERREQARREVREAEARYAEARERSIEALRSLERGVGSASAAIAAIGEAQRIQTRAAVAAAQATVAALLVRAPISGTVQLGGEGGGNGGDELGALVGSLPESVRGQAEAALGGGGSSGSVTTAEIVVGAPVEKGTPLVTVFDLTAVHLVASVDETDVFLVEKGVRADVELDAVPGARYTATVTAVDLAPTESARGGVTYRVRLSLGPGTQPDGAPAPRPRPGMSAVADLRVRSATGALAVPAAAVIRQGSRDAVWLVAGGRARARVVRLGAQGDDMVEVRDGVAEGDTIVVRGADVVTEGDRVP
ncbi:MAG TPA: HlyD family efflux transporter periplasmic adaptor subunit [Frankiaceae bacterium]|nr:HlyD family efflux transporter periplasmic adaptor subunit [Frankiaceae bacterium]